ncbi:MAG: ABC transporter permease [Gemmatales bacterium]|nr:ABC transporter permease [Gemmatales bacterium]MCS7160520.1 ABC transporter permease [Gemmatales bacterium]MDW8175721.1 ABC transporter permease [Gemmatales bacterium]MDW8222450.1 ABC transporter permease [Gemmatales bacterium]
MAQAAPEGSGTTTLPAVPGTSAGSPPAEASPSFWAVIRENTVAFVVFWGDIADFTARIVRWMATRRPYRGTLLPNFYQIGVRSVPVIGTTGLFIGMVLAVQTYAEFTRFPGMKSWLGAAINASIIRELGPVLAATMLAGRVGSALAAELGTMRITEQIDALWCLGVNPIHYLVVPRFLACVVLIPLLTVLADFMGVLGGAAISTQFFGIESFEYWQVSQEKIGIWDIFCGLMKSTVFGAAIATISCHRGFHSTGGAEGVGRAATDAFVLSFVAILVLDFFLGLFFTGLSAILWPRG